MIVLSIILMMIDFDMKIYDKIEEKTKQLCEFGRENAREEAITMIVHIYWEKKNLKRVFVEGVLFVENVATVNHKM